VKGGGVRSVRREVLEGRYVTDDQQLVQQPVSQLLEMALGVQRKIICERAGTSFFLHSALTLTFFLVAKPLSSLFK